MSEQSTLPSGTEQTAFTIERGEVTAYRYDGARLWAVDVWLKDVRIWRRVGRWYESREQAEAHAERLAARLRRES